MDRPKTAYFISAPENSGNRMLVQCFCSAGCYGNPNRSEWFGAGPLDIDFRWRPPRIVCARSVPHGREVVDPWPIVEAMQFEGYRVVPVTVFRKREFAVAGQVRGYAHAGRTPEGAEEYIDLCVRMMYDLAARLETPLIVVPYEPFVRFESVRVALFTSLGLPAPTYAMFNANEGYTDDLPLTPR